jgi:hypothetical protein
MVRVCAANGRELVVSYTGKLDENGKLGTLRFVVDADPSWWDVNDEQLRRLLAIRLTLVEWPPQDGFVDTGWFTIRHGPRCTTTRDRSASLCALETSNDAKCAARICG